MRALTLAGKPSIRWQGDTQLSAIHAAYVVATDSICTDAKTQKALVGPATEINQRLLSASIDVATFWQRLFDEFAYDANNRQACEIALIAAGGSELQLEQMASAVSSRLGECRLAFQSRFPKLADQLKLRINPLKERWNAVADEILDSIATRIWGDQPPADWWPAKVTGIVVQPMRGGDGNFDSDSNKFWIEALLNDADPDAPEVLRVAWLLTQLAIEIQMREKSAESVSGIPWGLGSVPIVLAAGADVGVIPSGAASIPAALSCWRLGSPSTASQLADWWIECQESRSPTPVALKALAQKLRAANQRPENGSDLSDFTDL